MIAHGEIRVHDGAAAQSFTTAPAKMTGFAAAGDYSTTVDGDASVTPDAANDRIRCKPGVYKVTFCLSAVAAVAQLFQFHLRVNGQEESLAAQLLGVAAADTVRTCTFCGTVDLRDAVMDADAFINLEIYGESDAGGGAAITPVHAQMLVERLDG